MNASPRIVLQTDMAVLCAFDPKAMTGFVRRSREWVYSVKDGDYGKLEPVQKGLIAVWPLGGKGGRYSAKVIHGTLPEEWKPYEKGSVSGFGVAVDSGQLFVGPGERIPGDGFGDRLVDIEDEGKLIECPNGRYVITVHVLDWKGDDKFFNEDGEANDQAPPDLALVFAPAPAEGNFTPPRPSPFLLDFLPKPKMKPQPQVLPRPRITARPEVARPVAGRSRAPREKPEWKPSPDPLPPPKPGEIRVGMLVRHAQFGEGTVLFIREGFPKVKVDFRGREEKVDRSELTVVGY